MQRHVPALRSPPCSSCAFTTISPVTESKSTASPSSEQRRHSRASESVGVYMGPPGFRQVNRGTPDAFPAGGDPQSTPVSPGAQAPVTTSKTAAEQGSKSPHRELPADAHLSDVQRLASHSHGGLRHRLGQRRMWADDARHLLAGRLQPQERARLRDHLRRPRAHDVDAEATEMIAEACSLLRLETTSEEMAR